MARASRSVLLQLVGAACAAALLAAADPADRLAEEGRQIYETGRSPSGGSITARVSGAVLPGSALPCAGCHGIDGRGRPEGGVRPPAITGRELRKERGHVHPGGRSHGPFDDAAIARAIAEGIDPAGNRLDATMPRYTMSRSDVQRLIAWLDRIERAAVPGVGVEVLRIGTVLPSEGPAARWARSIRQGLQDHFDQVNARGGIHGRRLDLVVAPPPLRPESGFEWEGGPPFALVAPFTPGLERQLADWAEAEGIPIVGPVAPLPAAGDFVFQVEAGLVEQAQSLAAWLGERREGGGRAALLHDAAWAPAAQAGAAALNRAGFGPVEQAPCPAPAGAGETAGRLAAAEVAAVMLLCGNEAVEAFAAAAARIGFAPRLLLAGNLAGRAALALPGAFDGRVFLAWPTLPRQPGGDPARARALAAARVLEEALARAGRDLRRDTFVRALESLQDFDAGLAERVSFGAGGRIGIRQTPILAVDRKGRRFLPASGAR